MTRAVFMGTPSHAVPALETLSELSEVALVITRPDRPRGRSGKPQPPPVGEAARSLGLSVAQPDSSQGLTEAVAGAGEGVDVGLLVAYGRLIPPAVLAMPAHGFLNIHFSLLPRWRGAAPIERAILAGDTVTGITIIQMDEGLDTGPVVAGREVAMGAEDTSGSLGQRLSQEGADLLAEILDGYLRGDREPVAQRGDATYAEKLDSAEARLDLGAPAAVVSRTIRALNPRPGAFAEWRGQRLKLWKVTEETPRFELAPGELAVTGGQLVIGTGDGTLELVEVQPAGGRRMAGIEWAHGRREPLGKLR